MNLRVLKWIAGSLELFLGIPVIGGLVILSLFWTPLLIMLIIHIFGLVLCSKAGKAKSGHILGIVASALGWIPFLGMILHIVTAIIIMVEAAKND